MEATAVKKRERRTEELSDYYMIETGHGPVHIHVNYDEEGPTKVFANISPAGTEISGLASALAIVLSKYFELGGDPIRVLKHLNSVKSEKPFGFGKNRIDSIPHALSVALRNHLIKTGKLKTMNPEQNGHDIPAEKTASATPNFDLKIHCSKCYSANVGFVSGCSEPTCFDCGYSKCS